VIAARRNGDNIGQRLHRDGQKPVHGGTIPQLTVAIAAPAPRAAIGGKCQAEFRARRDGYNVSQILHRLSADHLYFKREQRSGHGILKALMLG